MSTSTSTVKFAFEELTGGGTRYQGPEVLKAQTLTQAKHEACRKRVFQRTDIRLYRRVKAGEWQVVAYRYWDRSRKWDTAE